MSTVKDYINSFPENIKVILSDFKNKITSTCPSAEEYFSYGMPGYKYKGKPLVYFAAFKNHIGFYATPHTHSSFEKELAKYKQGKGSVQFPLESPIPWGVIEKMIICKMQQIDESK